MVGLWLALRVVTLLVAALVSPIRPLTARERAIALWPPSAPAGAWLERALLAPWERRDSLYYIAIVARGYRADDGTAQFHPLPAWLALLPAALTGSPLLGLVLVSSLAALLLLLAFDQLARLDLPPDEARVATALLASAPPAFILFAPYSEALFLLWATLCLLWMRQGRWWLAGLAGALCALTRQQGVLLALPLAVELWQRRPTTKDEGRRREDGGQEMTALPLYRWLAPLLPGAGLLVWLVYRGLALSDVRVSLRGLQALIFSLLISPSAAKVVPEQAFLWPWDALGRALAIFWRAPDYTLAIDLGLGFAFAVLLALAWPRLRASYRAYTLAIALISFAYYTGPHYPSMGLPRHLLLACPVFIGVAPLVTRPAWMRVGLLGASLLGLLFLLLQYVIGGWVP